MMDLINAIYENAFLQNALLAGILSAISCGVIGAYVVSKKITFISGGISHTVLGGLGLISYLNKVAGFNIPILYGAILAALISALIIGYVTLKKEQDSDTIISALWAFGMAVGVIFLSLTPGYNTNLMGYLFGDIIMVSKSDLYTTAILSSIVVVVGLLFYKELTAICFDEEFARVKGINVTFYYMLLLCLSALTVVVLIQTVGLILVIALLSMPAGMAKNRSNSMWSTMLRAVIYGSIFTTVGILISYVADLPSGASIIMVTTLAFVISIKKH